ncbi:MAG: hypothetical protein DRI94_00290 [Bacteroidetes bacterium]|nr:MAG: hypothetical protein DRI94_00290 [Bacteroidota bacterium]
MEKKKSNKANLEKMKTLFFVISLGIVFAFINFAFNINSKTSENNTKISGIPVEGDRIPITRPPDEKPKPLKPEVKHFITEIINIIPENTDIDTNEYYVAQYTDDPIIYDVPDEPDDELIYNPSVKPQFPGGISALQQFIVNHTEYPIPAKENNIQGTVFLRFEVTKTGKIGKISVLNTKIDRLLQNEAVKVIKSLPEFKPGLQNGKPVRVWYSLPVSFKLN